MKNLIFYFAGLSMILFLASCNNESQAEKRDSSTEPVVTDTENNLTEQQQQDGWELLFDGKTLEGWRTFQEDVPTSAWQAKDGKIVFVPSREKGSGGDLITKKQYENFHFKTDWKISECGNSGIIFLIQEEGKEKTYHTGPEMQVLDNECHSDAQYPTHRAGSLYDLIQALPETVKPAGEWNTAEIILNDGHLILKLNDTQVVETQMFNDDWAEMVADSKFKAWDGFGTFRKGHLGFQDHGDEVEFKNIMIKEL